MGNIDWKHWEHAVKESVSPSALRQVREQFHETASEQAVGRSVGESIMFINRMHDMLIKKCLQFSETQMEQEGWGRPPSAYEFLLLGSAGRREQTLWSDQDNGLVYPPPPEAEEERYERYYLQLGAIMVETLEAVGYPPCEGNVLAREPSWCKSVNQWVHLLDQWLADPTWEHVRFMLIVADMRSLSGSGALCAKLKEKLFQSVKRDKELPERLLYNALRHKVLLNVFGGFVKESYGEAAGSIDIKYGAYIPLVNGVRLLAITAGIMEPATMGRISHLAARGLISEAMGKALIGAFQTVLDLRSRSQFRLVNGAYEGTGMVDFAELTKEDKDALKQALKTGDALQKFLRKQIGASR
ncbi:hypothetical protein DUZ99_08200 [Xylanibacillus composti]|uniref:CBS domain-containing protein n=1 Tax=Xylanibacillus composti TaxID=1572762 RepID=A0A8J4H3G0_9BACL|nr:DUF294 nucleotidyltransferase-like domain-containing protein [Xylanibacillus composti]MDT9724974.1 hypothetical protein [Xylanibacillus composti]GIQ68214.1 hypothetical protein XYCOK13_10380 [Xylanibacillus composti]